MPLTNEAYIAQLEQDKADLIAKIENYAEEQKASVIIFEDQKKLISEKEQQLVAKDEELIAQEEKITKLKARIKVLSPPKKSNPYATTIASDNETSDSEEIIKTNKNDISTQTEGITPSELEEQLLEKRVDNLKDFGSYYEKLTEKNQLITKLQQQIIAYRAKLAAHPHHTNNQEKNAVIILLLVILTSILFLK